MDYTQKAKQVAEQLIGMEIEASGLVAEIIETESYESGKQTKRRACMKLAPGQIGIMPYRGLDFLNIGTEKEGKPSCVMVRAVKTDELYDGPGKVGKILNAKNLEYLIVEKDIPIIGDTKPSTFFEPDNNMADNSLGRYRSLEYC